MRNIFITLIATLGFTSASIAATIAQLPILQNTAGYTVVNLDDAGKLVIEKYEYINSDPFHTSEVRTESFEVELHEKLYHKLLTLTKRLSSAKLQKTTSDLVCQMMPPKGPSSDLRVKRGYNWKEGFTGELEEVYDQRGCWASFHIKPKTNYDRENGAKLIVALESLGIQSQMN